MDAVSAPARADPAALQCFFIQRRSVAQHAVSILTW
jgi:hypothetical protein